jgi:hypothetical protein
VTSLLPPLVGYRAWAASGTGELRSRVMRDVIWEPGQVTPAATCDHPGSTTWGDNLPPHVADHPCGWHYYKTFQLLHDLGSWMDDVYVHGYPHVQLVILWGIVEVGGRVQEHEYGGRAQYARPTALIRRDVIGKPGAGAVHKAELAVCQRYGIPLLPVEEVV